jgi:hypothetical protein
VNVLILLPSNVGGSQQRDAEGEPFRMEAWPGIGAYLAEPICAKGLNGGAVTGDRTAHEAMESTMQSFRPIGQAWGGGPRALK